jgi:hypothetical protein
MGQDRGSAFAWYSLSAEKKNEEAKEKLKALEGQMTGADKSKGKTLLAERKAALEAEANK